jgi:hypothetical protein
MTTTYTVPDDPADPDAAALNVACPICGVQPGEPLPGRRAGLHPSR